MHHSTFIGYLASIYKPKTYVELGLYHGETMRLVQPHIQNGYGIDIKPNEHLENLKKFDNLTIEYKRTDDFFAQFTGSIDMAFIDADHCYESAIVDFKNVLKFLNPGGIILMHDTDPESDRLIDPGFCGDSYKMVDYLEHQDNINIVTLPLTEAGLSIITKKNDTRTLRRLL